jgi:hypothetical protein
MPIEIRELIITATVDEGGQGGASAQAAPASGANAQDKQEIVQECVDQVMNILKKEDRR